jgi:hypothetical protein
MSFHRSTISLGVGAALAVPLSYDKDLWYPWLTISLRWDRIWGWSEQAMERDNQADPCTPRPFFPGREDVVADAGCAGGGSPAADPTNGRNGVYFGVELEFDSLWPKIVDDDDATVMERLGLGGFAAVGWAHRISPAWRAQVGGRVGVHALTRELGRDEESVFGPIDLQFGAEGSVTWAGVMSLGVYVDMGVGSEGRATFRPQLVVRWSAPSWDGNFVIHPAAREAPDETPSATSPPAPTPRSAAQGDGGGSSEVGDTGGGEGDGGGSSEGGDTSGGEGELDSSSGDQ